MKKIAVYGAGGFGREVAWLVESIAELGRDLEVVCFIDDNLEHKNSSINDIPVMSLESARRRFPDAEVVSGIGSPRSRRATVQKAARMGFGFTSLIHPRTEMSRWIEIGVGTVICAGNILTTNIKLGRHVHINLDCTIGHDVIIEDYVTLAPGVHVSGYVHLGKCAYVGTGAVIINGTKEEPLVIGEDVVVGAGACVTKSIPNGLVVVGVPAAPLTRSSE